MSNWERIRIRRLVSLRISDLLKQNCGAHGKIQTFSRGQAIIRSGEVSSAMFVVISGCAEIRLNKETIYGLCGKCTGGCVWRHWFYA
jgi:CRP-like cAMP-binding protein